MKLSTKSRYGLKAVYILAKSDGDVVPLSVLSKDIGVSSAYIEQIMRLLKARGIIESSRGVSGGYLLAKPCEEITLGEVIRALEEDLEIVDCIGKTPCNGMCETKKVWEKVYDAINDTLDGMTLKDMRDNNI